MRSHGPARGHAVQARLYAATSYGPSRGICYGVRAPNAHRNTGIPAALSGTGTRRNTGSVVPLVVPVVLATMALLLPTRAFTRGNHRLIRQGQRAVLRELLRGQP